MIIEGIFILLFLGMLFFIYLFQRQKRIEKKLLKKYDERDDKSKQGEQRRNITERNAGRKRVPEVTDRELSTSGNVESERRELLQTAETIDRGETNVSPRKDSKLARIFKHRR